jgi:hypothetical protein
VRTSRAELAGPLALVVLAAFVLQASAVDRPFFADDYLFLDQVQRHPGLSALFAPDAIGNFFRPLSRAGYFALLTPLSFGSSAVFHVVNLALFALVLLLFARLAWRMLGGEAKPGAGGVGAGAATMGAACGAAFLAVHHAFDVPVAWVSGSQDLLALALALLALVLALEDRAWWGGLAVLAALLCKESVAPVAFVACVLVRAHGATWSAALRRAAPLALATTVWAAAWLALRANGAGAHAGVTATLPDAAAALVHGAQSAFGLELSSHRRVRIDPASIAALVVIAGAVAWASRGPRPRGKAAPVASPRTRVMLAGAAWFALGALATAPVVEIWSAYFYSFALCGVALALGAFVAARPPALAFACVLVPGLLCAQARNIDQFAARHDRWIDISHVDRAYLDRGMHLLSRLASELKDARPTVPPNTTFLFSGVPSFTGFQVGDGPFVRFKYHDPTLRSRFVSAFTHADVERGPVLFLTEYQGRLTDLSDHFMFALLGTVLVVGDHLPQAIDAFRAANAREPGSAALARLWIAWLTASGPRVATRNPVSTTAFDGMVAVLARGDTTAAFGQAVQWSERDPLDPRFHALVADVLARKQPKNSYTVFQAFAARTLEDANPSAWRRWAIIVTGLEDENAGQRAIARWRALLGPAADQDMAMVELERALKAHQPTQAFVDAGLMSQPITR